MACCQPDGRFTDRLTIIAEFFTGSGLWEDDGHLVCVSSFAKRFLYAALEVPEMLGSLIGGHCFPTPGTLSRTHNLKHETEMVQQCHNPNTIQYLFVRAHQLLMEQGRMKSKKELHVRILLRQKHYFEKSHLTLLRHG